LPKEGRSFVGDTMRVGVLVEMGRNDNNDTTAIKFFNDAIRISTSLNSEKYQYHAMYWLGKYYKKNGRFFEAIATLYQSLLIAENNKHLKNQAICLRDIADAHTWIDQNKKSIPIYEKSLTIFLRLKEYEEYVDCLNNLALAYYGLKDYDEAIRLFEKCMQYEYVVKGKLSEASYLSNLGSCYGSKKKYLESIKYFELALKVFEKLGPNASVYLGVTKAEMARVYLEKGDINIAIRFANEAYQLNSKYYGSQLLANEVLYKTYHQIGDNTKAFYYLSEYLKAKESTEKQDKDKRLASLKYQYDNQKSQAEIKILNLQKKFLIGGLIVFVIFVLVQLWNTKVLKKKNALIESQKNEITQISDELQVLNDSLEIKVEQRTQELVEANKELIRKNKEISEALFKGQSIERKRVAVELHDNLGATLSGIKWRLQAINSDNLSEKERKIYEGIMGMMENTYSEVRLISHNMLPAELETHGLTGAIEKLIKDLNQSGKIKFLFISNNFEKLNNQKTELELYSICMELVNNILKHSEATEASVTLTNKDENLFLEIKDNGKGMDESNTNGMGMNNIQNRINAISGEINFVSNIPKGTVIRVKIPYLEQV